MTIEEIIRLLDEKQVSICSFAGRYALYLRDVPSGFFDDFQRIDNLHTTKILDDDSARKAKAALAAKYKGEVSDRNV